MENKEIEERVRILENCMENHWTEIKKLKKRIEHLENMNRTY